MQMAQAMVVFVRLYRRGVAVVGVELCGAERDGVVCQNGKDDLAVVVLCGVCKCSLLSWENYSVMQDAVKWKQSWLGLCRVASLVLHSSGMECGSPTDR